MVLYHSKVLNFLEFVNFCLRVYAAVTVIVVWGVAAECMHQGYHSSYYFVFIGCILSVLETVYICDAFAQLLVGPGAEQSESRCAPLLKCFSAAAWLDGWPKTVLYCLLGLLAFLTFHLWWAVLAGILIELLGLLYLTCTLRKYLLRRNAASDSLYSRFGTQQNQYEDESVDYRMEASTQLGGIT